MYNEKVKRAYIFSIFVLAVLLACGRASSDVLQPVLVNLHGHGADREGVSDNGELSIEAQIRTYTQCGYDIVVWSPHSSLCAKDKPSLALFDSLLARFPITIGECSAWLGLEAHVEPGPNFQRVMGHVNNNHIGMVGITKPIPHGMPYRAAIELAHATGGLCVINHPGPGPSEWEEGYWSDPNRLLLTDGIEVFNGQLAEIGRFEDEAYRVAAQNAFLFASGSTDAHKANSPLKCATLVFSATKSREDILDALSKRRTVALFGLFDNLPVRISHLGELQSCQKAVTLSIEFKKPVASVSLFRGTKQVQRWNNVSTAEFVTTEGEEGVWSWFFRDGASRGQTSAIWLLKPASAPDFAFKREGKEVFVVNMGDARGDCVVEIFDLPPFLGGKSKSKLNFVLNASEKASVATGDSICGYFVANGVGYAYDAPVFPVIERDYRNNAFDGGVKWW